MAGKVDCAIFDDDRALDYAVDIKILLHKYDSTGLIRQLFSKTIDQEDYDKEFWWRKHRAFEDMCLIRKAIKRGGYPIDCNGGRYRKCQVCKV